MPTLRRDPGSTKPSKSRHRGHAVDRDRAAFERSPARQSRSSVVFPDPEAPINATISPRLTEARRQRGSPRTALQVDIADRHNRIRRRVCLVGHTVGAFHRSSSLQAVLIAAASPGTGRAVFRNHQLPTFVAKICVCLVNSITVSTETSDESFSNAMKSFIIGASAKRNA